MDLSITLNQAKTRFVAHGGSAKGGDKVNATVSTWPGWKRVAAAGRSVSVYAGPLSTASALVLSGASLTTTWEPEARERADVLLRRFQQVRDVLEDKGSVLPTLSGWPNTPRKPKPYQLQGVLAMGLLDGRCLLSDDMGLGKTAQALWLADMLLEGGCDRILVLCPASVKFNWQNEVAETLGSDRWPVQVIDGSAKVRGDQFAQLRPLYETRGRLVTVINHDLLKYLRPDQLSMLSRFVSGQLLLIDECHAFKNRNSLRSKIVFEHFCPSVGGARWRIGISGTPIRNTVEDIYSQVELVHPGTFHSYHWFLNRFTVQSTMKIKYRRGDRELTKEVRKVRRTKNEKELNLILNTLQIRRKKDEVSDLPPKVHTYPELELDSHTAKIYTAMKDYALLQLEEHDDGMSVLSPTCRTAVEAAARCEQIAQGCVGGVPDALMPKVSGVLASHAEAVPGRLNWLVFPKSAKLVWVQEQIATLHAQGDQVVVFGRFNAPLVWLASQYDKASTGIINGSVSAEFRYSLFGWFQSGLIRTMFVQVRIAEGFNLQASRDEIFLGRDWAWAVNKQAEDRCHRIGQTGTVNVQIPFVRGTIEVRQHQNLAAKEKDASSALCFRTIGDLKAALS